MKTKFYFNCKRLINEYGSSDANLVLIPVFFFFTLCTFTFGKRNEYIFIPVGQATRKSQVLFSIYIYFMLSFTLYQKPNSGIFSKVLLSVYFFADWNACRLYQGKDSICDLNYISTETDAEVLQTF